MNIENTLRSAGRGWLWLNKLRPLRWLVWLEALIGSALFFPEAMSECIQLSRHALGVSLGSALPLVVFPSLVLLAFDVALVANAIRIAPDRVR